MPDPSVVPDAQPAASSAAPEAPPSAADQLASLSSTELREWRLNGILPAKTDTPVETPPAESSPAVAVEDQPASTDASTVAASEPAKPAKGAEARIPELLAERARERDRADRAEQRARELEARLRPAPDARPAAPSPAPVGLVKPEPDTFPYGTSDPGYLEALTDYKVAVTLANARSAWDSEQRTLREAAEQQRIDTDFRARIVESRAKHPDYDAVALTNVKIPPGTLAEFWVKETPAGAEMLYHFQQPNNAAELQRILALPYKEQIVELVRLGDRLTNNEPAARSTNAPPPPPALKTRATPGDPIESALRAKDYGAYKRAADAADVAARRR